MVVADSRGKLTNRSATLFNQKGMGGPRRNTGEPGFTERRGSRLNPNSEVRSAKHAKGRENHEQNRLWVVRALAAPVLPRSRVSRVWRNALRRSVLITTAQWTFATVVRLSSIPTASFRLRLRTQPLEQGNRTGVLQLQLQRPARQSPRLVPFAPAHPSHPSTLRSWRVPRNGTHPQPKTPPHPPSG